MTTPIFPTIIIRVAVVLFMTGLALAAGHTPSVHATILTEMAEILEHPEQYDRQDVTVTGTVADIQSTTNQYGQPVYGFLLQNQAGTIRVISRGQAEVRDGDVVIVEGTFSRPRQVGRTVVDGQIKALSVRPLNRLDPDLVG